MNSGENRPTPVEQHLGDRLAALVDGELGHDARERVLSHLATCWNCKAEADEQRRLKSVFAGTAPPPPSEGLLARLQGLPAGGSGPSGGPPAPGLPDAGEGPLRPGAGFGGGRSPLQSAPLAGGSGPSMLAPSHGARPHRDHHLERSASRGRRFAFAAAGAFSLAALALSGTVGGGGLGGSTVAAGERGGSTANQATPAATALAASDREQRRRAAAARVEHGGGRGAAYAPVPSSTVSLRQQASMGLVAAARTPSTLAAYSAFTPSSIRPPRVVPEASSHAPTPSAPSAGAAPAPTPGVPMAGARP